MPLKRVPTDDEIDTLAKQFAMLWKTGAVVRPWLRQHGDMLLDLVHGDWSWAAIARAMTKAGITYRTGKAWTADWLQSEFYRARVPLKGYPRKRDAHAPAAAAPDATPRTIIERGQPPPSPTPEILPGQEILPHGADTPAKPEARFKPASFRPAAARQPLTEEEREAVERNRALTFGDSQA